MPDDTIITVDPEGYVRDIDGPLPDEDRALVVRQPEALNVTRTPEDMVGLATRMANALNDIVERRALFTTIRGKKYPHVEAWMTIARMDNVVCREVPDGIAALDDGSYEATVELIRLSDGLVIGRGSALCGAANDGDWTTRPAHMKRSMAVTRATSRAFRQQYSWIMALAGYEPTPADEMPGNDAPSQVGPVEELIGTKTVEGTIRLGGASTTKLEVRDNSQGQVFGFLLKTTKAEEDNLPQVLVESPLANDILEAEGGDPITLKGKWCRVVGRVYNVREAGHSTFYRMRVTAFETTEYRFPAEAPQGGPGLFPELSPDDEAELDKAALT